MQFQPLHCDFSVIYCMSSIMLSDRSWFQRIFNGRALDFYNHSRIFFMQQIAAVAQGVEWASSAVRSPVFPKNLHAKVSLSKMLNPELCLIEQQRAANRCTVWKCVWLGEGKTVQRFEWSSRLEKSFINTNPFTIYSIFMLNIKNMFLSDKVD